MPFEYVTGPHASVTIGGGVNGKVLKIQSDDVSCRWNDFPVYMWACQDVAGGSGAAPTSRLTVDPLTLTAFGTAHDTSTPAEWPPVYIPNALEAVLAGFSLQVKLTGTFITIGTFGNAIATSDVSGACVTWNETQGNPADTGWVDCSPNCASMSAGSTLKIQPALANGAAIGWQFADWFMETRWVGGGSVAPYCPNQDFGVGWYPPCTGADREGLFIALETDSCGLLTKDYDYVLNTVNAMNLGVTLSALGGHGHDIATPDPLCTSDPFTVGCCGGPLLVEACLMSGAECSGAVDTDEGN